MRQPRGQHGGGSVVQPAGRKVRYRHDHPVRRHELLLQDRGRSQGLRCGGLHVGQGSADDGYIRSLRYRCLRAGRGRCWTRYRRRPERGAVHTHRLCHRRGHRWLAVDRGDARRTAEPRPAPHHAVLRAGLDHQHDLGARVDAVWVQGPEPCDRHRLHNRAALHRAGRSHDRVRRCRCGDRWRLGSHGVAAGRWGLRGHAGLVHTQRRPPHSLAPLGQGPRRFCAWRRCWRDGAGVL